VRHLAVGEACPINGAAVSRVLCSTCPEFVSYRSVDGVATVGCRWGEDVASWLRREMASAPLPDDPPAAPGAIGGAERSHRGLTGGISLAILVAAFGVGLALSAYERS
jgi:hypothetical protein